MAIYPQISQNLLKFLKISQNCSTWQFFLHKYNLWYLWLLWALLRNCQELIGLICEELTFLIVPWWFTSRSYSRRIMSIIVWSSTWRRRNDGKNKKTKTETKTKTNTRAWTKTIPQKKESEAQRPAIHRSSWCMRSWEVPQTQRWTLWRGPTSRWGWRPQWPRRRRAWRSWRCRKWW